jgi:hypothetical protein
MYFQTSIQKVVAPPTPPPPPPTHTLVRSAVLRVCALLTCFTSCVIQLKLVRDGLLNFLPRLSPNIFYVILTNKSTRSEILTND